MAGQFLETYFTPAVLAAQRKYYGAAVTLPKQAAQDPLSDEEISFIQSRDSFYMATVSGNEWPYIQHRGGRPGFLRVLGGKSLAFADLRGNRQLLSTGNLVENGRVALFLMDYPMRARLKLLGTATVLDARDNPDLAQELAEPNLAKVVERIFVIEVISYDWNCPKYITPRFTAEEVEQVIEPLRKRITELEAALKARP